jgi:hypothetical protein
MVSAGPRVVLEREIWSGVSPFVPQGEQGKQGKHFAAPLVARGKQDKPFAPQGKWEEIRLGIHGKVWHMSINWLSIMQGMARIGERMAGGKHQGARMGARRVPRSKWVRHTLNPHP